MTFKKLMALVVVVVVVGLGLLLAGCEGMVVITPTNQPPVAVISANPIQGYAKLQVSFDGSGSYDPDGQIISYQWDFGDGSVGSGVVANHLYEDDSDFNNDGIQDGYLVTLTVADDYSASGQISTIIYVDNPAPEARFNFSPSNPYTLDKITFEASGSYDPAGIIITPAKIISYTWDFGDGNSGQGMVVQHSYADDGSYLVTLTVTDDDYARGFYSHWISIRNRLPVANFTWRPCPTSLLAQLALEGIVPKPTQACIQFDGSSSYDQDGYIVEYKWAVKDQWGEARKQGKVVAYILERGYRYPATLTVTDDDGASSFKTEYVGVY